MRDLAQQLGRYRTVEYKISVKELNFLHSLPPSDWRRTGIWAWLNAIVGA